MKPILIRGDARMLPLADESVDLVVTSPPYWSLRDYEDGGTSLAGQIGAEPTPGEYIDNLIRCTAEWTRVLKPAGSIFVNLGDKYRNGSLLHLPERYRIAAVDRLGLQSRSVTVWHKTGGGLREKPGRRNRRTHEEWVHLTRTNDYYADLNPLYERPVSDYRDRPQYRRAMHLFTEAGFGDAHLAAVRAVGVIDTRGGQVRSGGRWTSESGRLAAEVRKRLRSYYRELCGSNTAPRGNPPGSVWSLPASPLKLPAHLGGVRHHAAFPLVWPARLIAGWCPPGGVVLDPMGGTGTVALAASVSGRVGITADLSADYCRAAAWRVSDPGQQAKARNAFPQAPDLLTLVTANQPRSTGGGADRG